MNERIRELWSQAGGHYDSGNQHTWPQYTIDDPEKFAELIIQECVAIVADAVDRREPASTYVGKIKDHFN
jgi:hypothetical protein